MKNWVAEGVAFNVNDFTLGAVVSNPVAFAILRITCGMGGIGCYMVSYVIAAETTLPSYKIITTTLVGIGFIFVSRVLGDGMPVA